MDKERSRMTQQAVLQLLRAQSDSSNEARAEFLAFARSSVNNVRELLLAQATLKAFENVDPQKQIDIQSLPKLPELPASVIDIDAVPPRRSVRPQLLWIASAAALAAVLFGWLLLSGVLQGSAVYTTEIGEQRSLKLADGSTVILNTASHVRIDYSERSRQVRLLEGEALFEVEHDAARPFEVLTESGVVRVLGTKFNVYRRGDATRVAVMEGAVQILPKDEAEKPAAAVRLNAGDEAELSRSSVTKEPKPDVSRAIAWRSHQLMFDNQRLDEVAREFNRYNHIQLTIQGDALRAVPLSGIFDADDVEPIVGFIARTSSLNAEVVRREKEIVIRQQER